MTDRATRLVLLCCNAVFLVVSVGCIFLCFMAQGGARLRVTALDRVGSLDATKVATAAPAGCVIPAAGPTPAMINRSTLGDRIAGQDQYMAGVTSKLFALLAFANLVICVWLLRKPEPLEMRT